ncbi:hypothetical protein LCGC14_0983350 [marine sediment metagenome]|uniref:Uncharacterized protein n=1 Tax=marine sediment metagenome TaxID=412755 RepID=A0A0F9QRA3_9ZZZZ
MTDGEKLMVVRTEIESRRSSYQWLATRNPMSKFWAGKVDAHVALLAFLDGLESEPSEPTITVVRVREIVMKRRDANIGRNLAFTSGGEDACDDILSTLDEEADDESCVTRTRESGGGAAPDTG